MNNSMIPLAECQDRGVYRIHARNFTVGAFSAATSGFIGIRQKFESVYLFTEYHHEFSESFGTARPFELIEFIEDPHIHMWERYPQTKCMFCGERLIRSNEAWEHVYPPDVERLKCSVAFAMHGGNYYPLMRKLERIIENTPVT